MTALLVAVVLVLAVVVVMVVGLLRSHAEILRALEVVNRASRGAASGLAAGLPLAPDREGEVQAAPILGTTVRGDQISLVLSAGGQNTLVAFLTSGCSTCQHFWDAFRQEDAPPLPGNARLVIVTKDSSEESPSKLLQLSPDGVSVVMSGGAWTDYDVPSAPYFVTGSPSRCSRWDATLPSGSEAANNGRAPRLRARSRTSSPTWYP